MTIMLVAGWVVSLIGYKTEGKEFVTMWMELEGIMMRETLDPSLLNVLNQCEGPGSLSVPWKCYFPLPLFNEELFGLYLATVIVILEKNRGSFPYIATLSRVGATMLSKMFT